MTCSRLAGWTLPTPRLLLATVGVAAAGAIGCLGGQDRSCSRNSECFEGEICRGGQCVADDEASPDATTDTESDDADSPDGTTTDGDCTPQTWYRDQDDDGYGLSDDTEMACSQPEGYAAEDGDCDDMNGDVHPEAEEVCNGTDDNCSGTVDDGFGTGESCSAGEGVCEATGEVVCAGDQAVECNASPDLEAKTDELCLDALDNDCDGDTDESDEAVGVGFTRLEVGAGHMCGLTSNKKLYCWGHSYGSGTLGDGSTGDASRPVEVRTSESFRDFSLGGRHTCAISDTGVAYCWGRDRFGQLGDGPSESSDRSIPVRVDMPTDGDGNEVKFTSIDTGSNANCALTSDGAVYCWGESGDELGLGATTSKVHTPTKLDSPVSFKSIAKGRDRVCGLADASNSVVEGTAYCWGHNEKNGTTGALGTGSDDQKVYSPERVQSADGSPLVLQKIRAEGNFTCGLSPDGELLCWGFNGNGQTGIDSSIADPVTTPNTISLDGATEDVADFGVGYFHTCAIRSDRSDVYCWGSNERGEIGNPGVSLGADNAEPTEIELDEPLASIAGGWDKTCARSDDGRIYCWGNNNDGSSDRLGVGDDSAEIRTPMGVVCP